MMKLELVEGYCEATNKVILSLCLVQKNEIVTCLAVLVSAQEQQNG
jgi:hypothetical protein